MSVVQPDLSYPALVGTLRTAGCVFAEDEARLLLATARTSGELSAMVGRRVAGLPLEHVLGWAEFCGLRIAVDPGVFVPRRRTEFLAARAVELAGAPAHRVVVDLCCGTGAVAAVLVAELDRPEVHAADIDPAAVACARRNLPDPDRVHEGDLFDALPADLAGRIDLLVVNAPYVPTGELGFLPPEARLHEPRVALDGGEDGLDIQRRVTESAARWLARGGHLLIETSERQSPRTVEAFARNGLHPRVVADDEMDATVVIGELAGPPAR